MLAAFEAAARTGSFSAAARELNLTQSAISRQIRALETQLGEDLFLRDHQQVTLTDAGATYAEEIRRALNMIRSATLGLISDPKGGSLNLAILPTFGTRWLIPRLPSFLKQNPGITVNFTMRLSPFDFQTEDLHAAIHYGLPDWPGAECTFLMGEEVIPVFAPSLAEQYRLERHEDFLSLPLLHLSTRPDAWLEWFAAHDLTRESTNGMVFEQFSSVTQAAVAGLGAAILPAFLIESELETGALLAFPEGTAKSTSAYYLVVPRSRTGYIPVAAFRAWLSAETRSHYER
jgi:LysR family glycine cleavage system transcriptional activator